MGKCFYIVFIFVVLISCNPVNKGNAKKPIALEEVVNENFYVIAYTLYPYYNDSTKWTNETRKVLRQHVNFLDSLGKEGILIYAGRSKYLIGDSNLFGIVLAKYTDGIENLEKIFSHDPTVVNKIQQNKVHPFSVGIQHFENISK